MRETKRETKVIVRYIRYNIMYRYYFIIVVLYVVMRLYNTLYNPTTIPILQYTALVALGTQLAKDLATIGHLALNLRKTLLRLGS